MLSRRDAILGLASAAVAAGLPGCAGNSPATPPSPSPSNITYDLIVVGAGIAGISAARTAMGFGGKVLVLEAQNRIGGRAYTDTATFSEIGFDLGAQFFQACLSGNEMFDLAQQQGLDLLAAAGTGSSPALVSAFTIGSNPAGGEELNFLATTALIKKAIAGAGSLIALGAADAPISSVVSSLSSEPWYIPALQQAVTGIMGNTGMSILDLYDYTLLQPAPFATPGDDYIVRSGMGTFVSSLAKGLPIMLNSPVTSITTGGQTVTVTANGASYKAKTVVVTAPTNVLAKSNATGGIQFNPALPAAYVSAFANLPLVPIFKALLGFKPSFQLRVPGATPQTAFSVVLPLVNSEISAFFPNFWNTNTCEFIADGDLAQTLESTLVGSGPAAAAAMLLAEMEPTFPGATAAWDGRITGSTWISNPYFGGAFSAAKVGATPERALIAQPIGNQLWFAGEAVNAAGDRGLLQAAKRSGAVAAQAAMKQIGLAIRNRA